MLDGSFSTSQEQVKNISRVPQLAAVPNDVDFPKFCYLGSKVREKQTDDVEMKERETTLPMSLIILAVLLLILNLSQFCRNAALR